MKKVGAGGQNVSEKQTDSKINSMDATALLCFLYLQQIALNVQITNNLFLLATAECI